MRTENDRLTDPRIQAAIAELRGTIQARYPAATFSVFRGLGDDVEGDYLETTVDLEDTDEVVDLVIDRLVDLQVEEGLPIRVLPVRPPERIAAMLAARRNQMDPNVSASG